MTDQRDDDDYPDFFADPDVYDEDPPDADTRPDDDDDAIEEDPDEDWEETPDDLAAIYGTATGSILDDLPSTKPPGKRGTWWGALPGDTTDFWDQRVAKGRGAAQVSNWLGIYRPIEDGSELSVYLGRNLAFIRGLAAIVTKKMTSIGWAQTGTGGAANPLKGTVLINPGPVKRAARGEISELDAQTYTGGVAIHEAAHVELTGADWFQGVRELTKVRGFGKFRIETLQGLAGMIEDGYIEATVIKRHPGHQAYLAEAWTMGEPERAHDYARDASTKWDTNDGKHAAIKLMEEINRRYTDPPPDALDALTQDQQRFVRIGCAILARSHNPDLDVPARMQLSTDFIKLVLKGQVPPEERQGHGKGPATTPRGPVEGDPDNQRRIPGRGESKGTAEDALTKGEHDSAVAEAEIDRVIHQRPQLNNGYREVPVHAVNGDKREGAYRQEIDTNRDAIRPLARAIALRNTTAEAKVPKQLRGKLDGRRLAEVPILARTNATMRIYRHKDILSAPDYGIILLIDRSASMTSGYRDRHAKATAAIFLAALDQVNQASTGSIECEVHAHHSAQFGTGKICMIERIVDAKRTDRDRVAQIYGTKANYDAAALWWAIKQLKDRWPDRARLLIHISDGMPNESGYGGPRVHQVIADLVSAARRDKTAVMNLFIGEKYQLDARTMAAMYGPEGDGWLHVERPDLLPTVFGKVLERQLRWHA